MSGVTSKELAYQRFVQRELGLSHPTYDSELSFYNNVKNGDIEALKKAGKLRAVSRIESRKSTKDGWVHIDEFGSSNGNQNELEVFTG